MRADSASIRDFEAKVRAEHLVTCCAAPSATNRHGVSVVVTFKKVFCMSCGISRVWSGHDWSQAEVSLTVQVSLVGPRPD